jgi:hypothetical protein
MLNLRYAGQHKGILPIISDVLSINILVFFFNINDNRFRVVPALSDLFP